MIKKIKRWLENNKRLAEKNRAFIGKLVIVETEGEILLPGTILKVGWFYTEVELSVMSIFGTLHPIVSRPHRCVSECSGGIGEAGFLMLAHFLS